MCSDRIPPKPTMHYDTGQNPPDRRIKELHVWISTDANGGEGMLSADLPLPFGTRHTPLMSSKRETSENMRPIAEHLQRIATTATRRIGIELRTFRQAEPTDAPAAPKHTPAPTDVARMRDILRALGMRRAIELLADASEQEAEAPSYATPISFAFRTNASILRGLIGRLFPDR